MNYVAITHDGRQYTFPGEFLKTVERAMDEKAPVRLEGLLVQGSAIARIDKSSIAQEEYGPHLSIAQQAYQVFSLPSGELSHGKGWWQETVACNMEREKKGMRRLRNHEIDQLRDRYGKSLRPSDLLACWIWEGGV